MKKRNKTKKYLKNYKIKNFEAENVALFAYEFEKKAVPLWSLSRTTRCEHDLLHLQCVSCGYFYCFVPGNG